MNRVRTAYVEDNIDLAKLIKEDLEVLDSVELVDVYASCSELLKSRQKYDYIIIDKESNTIPSNVTLVAKGMLRILGNPRACVFTGGDVFSSDIEVLESLGLNVYSKLGSDFENRIIPDIYQTYLDINKPENLVNEDNVYYIEGIEIKKS